MRGQRFNSIDDLKDAVDAQIGSIASHEYQEAVLRAWPKRLVKCLSVRGQYFEGMSDV